MPMPVSETVNAITEPARARVSFVGLQPLCARATRTDTSPRSVNLNALESRFFITWRRRPGSVAMAGGRSGASCTENATPFWSATWSKSRSRPPCNSAMSSWLISSVTVPDSTFARSRMSSSSRSRSVPEEWMTLAYWTCVSVRFSSWLPASSPARMSRLLSGVRSSCDMFEKNSDLYFEVIASCSAFSSTRRLARSTSAFLRSTSVFCSARSLAWRSRSSLEPRSSC